MTCAISEVEALQEKLRRFVDVELELVINNNRVVVLHLLEKTRHFARLSVHQMFLQAPDAVLDVVADYVRGKRKEKQRQIILRRFIQEELAKYDYSHKINPNSLTQQGKVYDLNPLYHRINEKYFNGEISVPFTWYGQKKRSRGQRIIFGQYLDGLRLIKIHRILDDHFFPEYFVAFVIYHEMLHSVMPGKADKRGRFCYHTPEFKEREKEFEHYAQAMEWERKHKSQLFN